MQANVRRSMADALPPLFCDPCRKVHVLRPENRIAWDVFETCRSQQIRSEGVLIGLDHRAIREEIADRNGREDARVTYRALGSEIVRSLDEVKHELASIDGKKFITALEGGLYKAFEFAADASEGILRAGIAVANNPTGTIVAAV